MYMEDVLNAASTRAAQDQSLSAAIQEHQTRLRKFIRRRVVDEADAEDILQDVFGELVEAYRLMHPVEEVTAWLYQVARNRIIDLFRKSKPSASADLVREWTDGETAARWEDLLPSPDAGPHARYARQILLQELETALAELPTAQRRVFLDHEFAGKSFKEMAEATGVNVNTLLARKRYAVAYLRERLREIRTEFL
jgi:RNA polymerase sigma factor (sigma-70 family)